MSIDFNTKQFEKLANVIEASSTATQRTGDDDQYQKFVNLYPASSIKDLTVDQYCLGHDSDKENFCWWLERGLESVLGRYAPGTSKGHLIYKMPDNEFYLHRRLSDLPVEQALKYTLAIQSVIANANATEDLRWIDNDKTLYTKANVEPRVTVGAGRKLRLVAAYNPDTILPIASSDHVRHFLSVLGIPDNEIPTYNQPFGRLALLTQFYQKIKSEHKDNLTPFGFVKALYSDEMGIRPVKEKENPTTSESAEFDTTEEASSHALNQILYGPPGTGKTFSTVERAVQIADPDWYEDAVVENEGDQLRIEVKQRYEELIKEDRIAFTTFHQSFSYEDFIEGIRATKDLKDGNLQYEVVGGVFKNLCEIADVTIHGDSVTTIALDGRRIWKMSLGNTLEGEEYIYDECLEKNYVLLGYGDDINFSHCDSRTSVKKHIEEVTGQQIDNNNYTLSSVNIFKNIIKKGDLIIVSDGNHKFRAIAEIIGDYEFLETDERVGYQQLRRVNWLREYKPSLPKDRLFSKALSQMTLYELKPSTIDHDKLTQLLAPKQKKPENKKPHIFIIDEINRGNISRIFGELITLLEPDKRKGGSDQRSTILPYSKDPFSVPDNIYVIGTMNTADKSLAQIDLALRRRFTFIEIAPNPRLLDEIQVYGTDMGQLLEIINERIEVLLDRDHLIGHSYFLPLGNLTGVAREEKLAAIFRNNILPLLQEYFFEDWERIRWVLNDVSKQKEFQFVISGGRTDSTKLFHNSVSDQITDRRYRINDKAFNRPEAYQGILNGAIDQ